MLELTFLGTGSMTPTKDRNHSGVFIKHLHEGILVDCGENIQRQMKVAGLSLAKVTRILISHWHGDHTLGLPGLIQSMNAAGYPHTLHVYGPKGTKKYFEHLFQSFAAKGIVEHEINEVTPGIFFETEDFYLEAQELKHSVPCIGFSFVEKERLRINVDKAQKLGLQGPILGKLQNGEDIIFKGEKIKAKDVTYKVEKKKIVKTAAAPAKIKGKKTAPAKAQEVVAAKKGRQAKEDSKKNEEAAPIKGRGRGRSDDIINVSESSFKVDIEKEIKESLVEEILSLSESFSIKSIFDSLKLVDYFQSDSDECIEKDCDNPDTTLGYCRYHYIKNWADIKKKQNILLDGKLQRFVTELMEKYPIKYLEAVLTDLADEKAFYNSLKELDIESAAEVFDDVDNDLVEDEQDIAFETKGLSSKDFEEI